MQDRINRDAAEGSFNEIAFNAKFASDVLEYSSLEEIPGVDGFIMDVDPLYKVLLILLHVADLRYAISQDVYDTGLQILCSMVQTTTLILFFHGQ